MALENPKYPPILHPANEDDCRQLIETANREQTPLHIADWSMCDAGLSIRLDLGGLNKIVQHRTEEFIAEVETGISMGQLNAALQTAGQHLPLAYPSNRMLLGVLAEESLSLSETRYAPLRHWVLGTQAITGDGQPIHYGGAVMKNVTGYDLNKLFIGSHHQYGVMTRVTLKLMPQPETTRALVYQAENLVHALDCIHRLIRLCVDPQILTLFRDDAGGDVWHILMVLSGHRPLVQQAADTVQNTLSNRTDTLKELYLTPQALDQWLTRLDWTGNITPETLTLRLSLPTHQMLDLPYRFFGQPWLKSAQTLMPLQTNRMFLRWDASPYPDPDRLRLFQQDVAQLGGRVRLCHLPHAWQPAFNMARFNADPQPAVQKWQARLKQQFDPNGILSPAFPCFPIAEDQV